MSIFTSATISGNGGDFETAEAGVYICRFKEVVVTKQPSFDDPNVMEDRCKWVFETVEESDSEGRPFRFVKFTSAKFGNDKSKLTQLMDQMAGRRLSEAEFRALDEEKLKRSSWKVMVTADPSPKDGRIYNNIVSVRNAAHKGHTIDAPVKPAPKPKAVEIVAADGIEDPFA